METEENKELLVEMAMIGTMPEYDVVVYTKDAGYIPHVHIIDSSERGGKFDCCVMLEDNRYFTHGKHQDTLNSAGRKMFNDFMHEPCRLPQFKDNYSFAVAMWNVNNSNSYVQVKEDENGNTVIPDYRTIKPYKTECGTKPLKDIVREVITELERKRSVE